MTNEKSSALQTIQSAQSAPAEMKLRPSLADFSVTSLKVGCLGFGGPAGQIALMHKIFVDEKKWIDEPRYLHALNYCMLLPGPEAQQLAVYIGWLLHGVRGGIIGGAFFVAPGALIVLALSFLYVTSHHIEWVAAAFFGVKAAVFALVLEALVRVGKRALKARFAAPIAIASFLALFFGHAWFPIVILVAGLFGVFSAVTTKMEEGDASDAPLAPAASARGALMTAGAWLAAWLAPVAMSFAVLGPDHVLSRIGKLFSTLAIVTFGGAYATLAYLQQEAVNAQNWLSAGEMIDGLGLAETTPGPLVLVNQFVGFFAGWHAPGHGLTMALLGAAMASWCTFAPSFVWIFAGAPYTERLRANRVVNTALQAISAAVLGVIANLAVWFAVHVLFSRVGSQYLGLGLAAPSPDWSSLDAKALALSALAIVAVFRFRLGVLTLVIGAAIAGIVAQRI